MNKILACIFSLGLIFISGCYKAHKSPVPAPIGALSSDPVTIDDQYINFIKVFHTQVTPDVELNVTSTLTPYESLFDNGMEFEYELKQTDGNSIYFDCDHVADKILENKLVPLVEADCSAIRADAKQYWKTNPNPKQFTDSKGQVWTRQ